MFDSKPLTVSCPLIINIRVSRIGTTCISGFKYAFLFIVPFVLLYYYLLTIIYIYTSGGGLARESATLQVKPCTLEGI